MTIDEDLEDLNEPETLPEEIVHWQPNHRAPAQVQAGMATGGSATGSSVIGALALGAFALGAVAVGAMAIGALRIGKLNVRNARFGRLEVDELVVRSLKTPNRR